MKTIALNFAFAFLLSMNVVAQSTFNSQFISVVIPDTLTTDEIFPATIKFKNTGTSTWGAGGEVFYLISQNPTRNYTWGTYFIILGQGHTVAPGDTFNFASNLRAPSTPGKWAFA